MIEIFHTLIDEKEVIGVSPLYSKRPSDPGLAALYNERQFYFRLYTTRYHFTIDSDWLSFNEGNKKGSDAVYNRICKVHETLRRCLIDGDFSSLLIYKEHDKQERDQAY